MGNEDVWWSRAAMLLNECHVLLHRNWEVAGIFSSRWCDQWSYSNSTAMEEARIIWSQVTWDVWDYRALVAASPPEWAGVGLSGGVGSHREVTSGHPKLSKKLSGVCANAVLWHCLSGLRVQRSCWWNVAKQRVVKTKMLFINHFKINIFYSWDMLTLWLWTLRHWV